MNTYDIIFWYTGMVGWSVVAVLLALAVIAFIVKAWKLAWDAYYSWKGIRILLSIPTSSDNISEATAYAKASNALNQAQKALGVEWTDEQWIKFLKTFQSHYKPYWKENLWPEDILDSESK